MIVTTRPASAESAMCSGNALAGRGATAPGTPPDTDDNAGGAPASSVGRAGVRRSVDAVGEASASTRALRGGHRETAMIATTAVGVAEGVGQGLQDGVSRPRRHWGVVVDPSGAGPRVRGSGWLEDRACSRVAVQVCVV